MAIKWLLNFARQVAENILREVLGQVNIVDNLIQQTVRSYIQAVVGGAWQGTAADEFVNKVEQIVAQQGFPMRDMVQNLHTSVTNAMDTIDRTDKNARSVVDSLVDTFNQVF